MAIEVGCNGAIERLAVRVVSVPDARCRDAGFLRAFQAERIRSVTEHDAEFEIEVTCRNGIDKSLQVGPRSGDQDRGSAGHQTYCTAWLPGMTVPNGQACSPFACRMSIALGAWTGLTTTTMPTPQLNVRRISAVSILPCCCRKSNTAPCSQDVVSIATFSWPCSTRGMFSVMPPPV